MGKRYYYTDPLAAGFMAIRHRMQFETDFGFFVDVLNDGDDKTTEIDVPEDLKLYIHPDSLHLLEPQVGDLVNSPWNGDDHYGLATDWTRGQWDERLDTIFQRNGIPFMWPESEEV